MGFSSHLLVIERDKWQIMKLQIFEAIWVLQPFQSQATLPRTQLYFCITTLRVSSCIFCPLNAYHLQLHVISLTMCEETVPLRHNSKFETWNQFHLFSNRSFSTLTFLDFQHTLYHETLRLFVKLFQHSADTLNESFLRALKH